MRKRRVGERFSVAPRCGVRQLARHGLYMCHRPGVRRGRGAYGILKRGAPAGGQRKGEKGTATSKGRHCTRSEPPKGLTGGNGRPDWASRSGCRQRPFDVDASCGGRARAVRWAGGARVRARTRAGSARHARGARAALARAGARVRVRSARAGAARARPARGRAGRRSRLLQALALPRQRREALEIALSAACSHATFTWQRWQDERCITALMLHVCCR